MERQTTSETISINVSDFNQLHEATSFSKVPLTIVDYFHDKDISIDGQSPVLKHNTKTEWYIIDNSKPFWVFFYLKTGKRTRNKFPLQITRETPDFNTLKDDPRWRKGIFFPEDELRFDTNELYVTTTPLDKKQHQKSDYFFRIARNQSPLRHERTIYKLAAWSDEFYKKLTFSIAKVGAFTLAALFVLISIWWYIAIPLIAFVGYNYFKGMFLEFWNLYSTNKLLNDAVNQLEKERKQLTIDNELSIVSNQQMELWLEEEVRQLDQTAMQTFELSKEAVIPFEESLKTREITGINLEEWALLQPLSVRGKSEIEVKHLRAFRFEGATPVYGVYYITLLYFTAEAIHIYSCFYDFVLAQSIQPIAKKYNYYELAKIEATIELDKIEQEIKPLEIQKIIFNFYNKDSLQIALSDALGMTNLKNKMEGVHPETGDTTPSTPIGNQELKKLFNMPAERLVGYRNNIVLTSIHHFCKEQKMRKAQQASLTYLPSKQHNETLRYV